jgi:DNA-binding transcriptional LysR family regulator
VELTDIDLNQLVLFHQLILERSITKVADNLGVSQPAVSNSLAKLRRLFGDDLFVRTASGMVPTAFAEQLAEPVGQALATLNVGLNQQLHFDPASIHRSLTLGMTDIGEIVFLPALVKRLRREAPGVQINTVRNSAMNLREEMESGKVDMAIGPLPQLKGGFFHRRLFRQRYVCLFRQGHALERKRISAEDFRAAEHLGIVSAGTAHGRVESLLRKAGIERNVILTVPHFISVGHILRETNLVATVTETLAASLTGPFQLAYRPLPVALPEISINISWHAKVHRSPVHQWLREMIFDLFGKDKAPPGSLAS